MIPMRLFAAGLLCALACAADVSKCACELSDPARMAVRECGLCREAEKQPAEPAIFILKDINPRKPNRWLALPRYHSEGAAPLSAMTPAQRTALWTAAIAKARELFGDRWGIAMNGDAMRTQCHTHVHIGKLLDGVEIDNFVVVDGPSAIPVPQDGSGLWIHPAGGKLHVHLGEQITETVLLR
jgi:CDP-diacylglycerol pyrophosphatase